MPPYIPDHTREMCDRPASRVIVFFSVWDPDDGENRAVLCCALAADMANEGSRVYRKRAYECDAHHAQMPQR